VDNVDQQILYAIRDAVVRHEADMNANDLPLGGGLALLDASRARWQADPDEVVSFSAAQVAAALAAARHQGMEDAYQIAQNVIAGARNTQPAQPAQPAQPVQPVDAPTRFDLRRVEPTAET
jgi:hypothetical protein